MFVFLNGQFIPEEQAVVSVFDRGFLYGDGLFETVPVRNRKPFRWTQHMERLRQGADFLQIRLPFPLSSLRQFCDELVARNQLSDALLRLTLSRGVGPGGYSPKGAGKPTLTMSLRPFSPAAPPAWKLITSSFYLPAGEPLAQFKTCNKLPQILARAAAEARGADEALLLNTDGFAVEGAGSNLFWIERDTLHTPPLAAGILGGVTRATVLEICSSLGLKSAEGRVTAGQLRQTSGVFMSLSSFGVVEARELDGKPLSSSPITRQIQAAYFDLLRKETD